MRKIVITSDSTCDLEKEILEQYDIKVVPLYINVDGVEYKDGIDITTPEMYKLVDEKKSIPKTAATSVGDFINFFTPYYEEGYDIIYTGISSTMSVTYNNALTAASMIDEEGDRIFVIDSGNLSTGIGLLLLKACKAKEEGKSAKEIKELMESLVPKVRSQFVVETLDYLHKGGRCSGVVKFIGNILKLRIQIEVFEKSMRVAKKTIGAMKKALSQMVHDYLDKFNKMDDEFVFVTHSEAYDSKDFILNLLAPVKEKIKNLFITRAGCVISSHCGQGCIGILYIEK
ncbi:MAG: DegV family protein [Bacilli bacterium]|nr:DegV family protein [Bacilli bacterium]